MFVTKVNYAFRLLSRRITFRSFFYRFAVIFYNVALRNSENNNFRINFMHTCTLLLLFFIWPRNCDSCFNATSFPICILLVFKLNLCKFRQNEKYFYLCTAVLIVVRTTIIIANMCTFVCVYLLLFYFKTTVRIQIKFSTKDKDCYLEQHRHPREAGLSRQIYVGTYIIIKQARGLQ